MPWPLFVGAAIMVAGTMMSGASAVNAAKANREETRRLARDKRALSHRAAYDEKKNAEFLVSRANAVIVAQGGTREDIINITGDITGQGTYNSLMRLWEGYSQGRSLLISGEIQLANARGQRTAGYMKTAGSIMASYSSMGSSATAPITGGYDPNWV